MPKLSIIIITFNEERNIENCLNSVVSFADEILVLDSYSTDRTKEIVGQYPFPVRFFEREFEGYGKAKNNLAEWANGDFIFSIDADEVVSFELKNSILKEKIQGFSAVLFDIKRDNIYCGRKVRFGGWNPDIKARLWKKGFATWDLSEVHETLILSEKATRKLLSGPLYHYSYQTRDEHFAKVEKYASRGATQLHKMGKRASILKQYLSPFFRFFRDYFLKLGFLDGKIGLQIALITAKEVYLKYRKLNELQGASN